MVETRHRKINKDYMLRDGPLTKKKHRYESIALSNQMPVEWHRAKDFNVFDSHGNKWIDMTSGIFVANAGHSNPKIKEAIKNQLDKNLMFAYQYNTNIRYEFVKKLLEISPNHFDKVVLLNSGSEATDAA